MTPVDALTAHGQCLSVYSLTNNQNNEQRRCTLLRHSTACPWHPSCVAMRVLPRQTPPDPVSSPGSPSLLQMCRAEPGSHRLERTGRTGMRRGERGVRTAGGGRRRRELDGRERKPPVGGLIRIQFRCQHRQENAKRADVRNICLMRASRRGTGCFLYVVRAVDECESESNALLIL